MTLRLHLCVLGACLAVLLGCKPAAGQITPKHFGWDLDYATLLNGQSAEDTLFLKKWLAAEKSPAKGWIDDWKGDPLVSSILIDYPAFHAGERTTMWFGRTSTKAFYRENINSTRPQNREMELPTDVYDQIFDTVSLWQPYKPKRKNDLPKDVIPGYFGFLSIYGRSGSHQLLLTTDDFVICINVRKGCTPGPGKLKTGRLMKALQPVFDLESD